MPPFRDNKPPPGSRLLALVGPTAVGKTELARRLAPLLGAEIISVDSMQVYRGMDIGTSKPPAADRADPPMHLIDVADPASDFSVAAFKELADSAALEVLERGRAPLLVGGSGLYFRAVIDDLDFAGAGPGEDPGATGGPAGLTDVELHALLGEVDPRAAAEIPPENRRRVEKALDVARRGRRLISDRQRSWSEYSSPYDLRAAGLEMDRSVLCGIIDRRVDAMVEAGLEREVERLRLVGLHPGTTAGEAIGYRQMLDYLEGGVTLEQTVEEIKSRTRNYARRQLTWFRKDPRVRWFEVAADSATGSPSLDDVAGPVLEYLSS